MKGGKNQKFIIKKKKVLIIMLGRSKAAGITTKIKRSYRTDGVALYAALLLVSLLTIPQAGEDHSGGWTSKRAPHDPLR